MVIDDTPANLSLLAGMLNARGFDVRLFPRGRMALAAARQEPPDLILLDINMPEMNGYDVCRQLKMDKHLRDVPVIFVSAHAHTLDKVKAFELGGIDYVTKPFHTAEVAARVETHLQLRRYRLELEQYNQRLQDMVAEQVREIADAQMSTILALSKLAESRDDDTGHHLERVQHYCRLLARELRHLPAVTTEVDDAFISNLINASPLHDVGKVGIPDAILLRPGTLSDEEFATMRTHAALGAQTLEAVQAIYPNNAFIRMGIMIARSHHERWDGAGYPDGLAGEEIPLPARIVALADVYDALRSKRCYKAAFSHEESRRIIADGRGTQFDPAIVDAFMRQEQAFHHIRTTMDDG
ncbi:MAG: Cyclic di-GMP phosphodiesterase response regulator RpfG [bacterium ADurb.Bin429]|nr:MAG: Cyclic di-GMP phosphodiesterase response regulator RpfG [bacterium ADurb.Bin429]